MYYSLIGILALIILVITNHDILFKRKGTRVIRTYRAFLLAIATYYLADIIWGLLDLAKLNIFVFFAL